MLWVTWRQHRTQLLATALLLLALGVFLWWNGSQASTGLNVLISEEAGAGRLLLAFLPMAAGLIGLFWGVPVLAREFERGTYRLAWTQSVSPGRWLAVKLGVLGLAVTLGGLALGGMINAWMAAWGDSRPIAEPGWFTVSGVAPAAWWLFLFALGTAAGALLRRTLPAMAVTIAVFVVTMYLLITFRPDYATPERVVHSGTAAEQDQSTWDDVWIVDVTWQTPDGRELASLGNVWTATTGTCPVGELECVYEQGYREIMYFHPASRYWRFQWTESAILLGGVVVLAGVTAYRVSRRG